MNKMRYLRIGLATLILVVIFACTFAHVPIGTLCALCPVGFAEISVASGSVPWALLPGVLILLGVIFVLGRVFCSWVCPTSWLRNIFGGSKPHGLTGQTGVCEGCAKGDACTSSKIDTASAEDGEGNSDVDAAANKASCAAVDPNKDRQRNNLLAQGVVLVVLLVVSFVVHFPMF